MARVSVAARSLADARCALCHDALGESPAVCEGCATALHRECRRGLALCPTLGCTSRSAGRGPPPPLAAAAHMATLAATALLTTGLVAATLLAAATVLSQREGESGCLVALALHAIVAPAAWASFQDHQGSPLRAFESRLARFAAAAAVLVLAELVLACALGLIWLASSQLLGALGAALPYLALAIGPSVLTWALFGRDPSGERT